MRKKSDPVENEGGGESIDGDRRAFVNKFGSAAMIAPPVITALLSTSLSSRAIAASTGGRGHGGSSAVIPVGLAVVGVEGAVLAHQAPQQVVVQAAPLEAPPIAPPEIEIPPAPPPPVPSPERG